MNVTTQANPYYYVDPNNATTLYTTPCFQQWVLWQPASFFCFDYPYEDLLFLLLLEKQQKRSSCC